MDSVGQTGKRRAGNPQSNPRLQLSLRCSVQQVPAICVLDYKMQHSCPIALGSYYCAKGASSSDGPCLRRACAAGHCGETRPDLHDMARIGFEDGIDASQIRKKAQEEMDCKEKRLGMELSQEP